MYLADRSDRRAFTTKDPPNEQFADFFFLLLQVYNSTYMYNLRLYCNSNITM